MLRLWFKWGTPLATLVLYHSLWLLPEQGRARGFGRPCLGLGLGWGFRFRFRVGVGVITNAARHALMTLAAQRTTAYTSILEEEAAVDILVLFCC